MTLTGECAKCGDCSDEETMGCFNGGNNLRDWCLQRSEIDQTCANLPVACMGRQGDTANKHVSFSNMANCLPLPRHHRKTHFTARHWQVTDWR